MPIAAFNNVGTVGIVPDINPVELPPEAWSNAQNVRFIDGKAEKCTGHAQVFGAPAVAPYWLLPVSTQGSYYWLYAGLDKVYVTDGNNHYNLTRQSGGVDADYAASVDLNWTGGILGGVPILNNGLDDPQMWLPATPGQRLQSLTYEGSTTWADKNYRARVIRPYRGHLVALGITKAGVEYPHMVKWSHPADPGSVPQSWNEADTTKDAGESALAEGGALIDCLPLKDTNILYAEDTTWAMQYIGGQYVFRFAKLFDGIGAISRRCVQSFGSQHIVFTSGDLVIHDGQRAQSLVDNRTRRWLVNNVDETYFGRSFIAANQMTDEMWVCFPSQGASLPDKALIWNHRDGTFGVRDLPGTPHIGFGVVNPGESEVWNDDAATWDSDPQVWNKRAYNPIAQANLICAPNAPALYRADEGESFAGSAMTAFVERRGLHTFQTDRGVLGGVDRVKTVKAVWPRIEGTGTVNVYVGAQMSSGDGIDWSPPRPFRIGIDRKVDVRVTGRLIAVRFESTDSASWKLSGYDLHLEQRGRH